MVPCSNRVKLKQPASGSLAMDASPPLVNAKQQLLEREAECRHMSTLPTLSPERRREFEKMADRWAQLAAAITEQLGPSHLATHATLQASEPNARGERSDECGARAGVIELWWAATATPPIATNRCRVRERQHPHIRPGAALGLQRRDDFQSGLPPDLRFQPQSRARRASPN
jgi:hypothetical protein